MSFSRINVILFSQCLSLESMSFSRINVILFSQCLSLESMSFSRINVILFSQCLSLRSMSFPLRSMSVSLINVFLSSHSSLSWLQKNDSCRVYLERVCVCVCVCLCVCECACLCVSRTRELTMGRLIERVTSHCLLVPSHWKTVTSH